MSQEPLPFLDENEDIDDDIENQVDQMDTLKDAGAANATIARRKLEAYWEQQALKEQLADDLGVDWDKDQHDAVNDQS